MSRPDLDLKNPPAGAQFLTLNGMVLVVPESVVARLVQSKVAYLCGKCPCYHITSVAVAALAIGLAAMDLRDTDGADVEVTEDVAAMLGKLGKGGA